MSPYAGVYPMNTSRNQRNQRRQHETVRSLFSQHKEQVQAVASGWIIIPIGLGQGANFMNLKTLVS